MEPRTPQVIVVLMIAVAPLLSQNALAIYDQPTIILESAFVDAAGSANVVGTVRNFAQNPVEVKIGLKTSDGSILETDTFGRVLQPLTDAPFKFTLPDGLEASGKPYIMQVSEVEQTQYSTLLLSYDGMAVGEERAFVGTVKNTGSFEVRNVSVYAAVHSPDHRFQLDSVRSNVIPVIMPGEEREFIAVPDPAIRDSVIYFSCAGLDYDDPITTVKLSDGRLLPYDMRAVAQVSGFKYDDSADSLVFGIRPYSPEGGDVSLQIPQLESNHTVSVFVDGVVHDASVTGDGKTINIDFFVPSGEHEVQVQGVRNIPEFSNAIVAFSAAAGAAIVAFRIKAAFKMS